jgi:hypothetical protein
MTCITKTQPKRRLSAKLAAGLAISAFLVLGTFVTSASAQGHRGDHRGGGEHRGGPRGRAHWGGGYYPAPPPVVYGSPYYYPPPPVVYGPALGIAMLGLTIGIR